MRVAYIVSRFPVTSETFIVRELDSVIEADDVEIDLYSLFPSREAAVHPRSSRWMSRLYRPGPAGAGRGLIWAAGHSPRVLFCSFAAVLKETWRQPSLMARSLVSVAGASELARRIEHSDTDHIHAHFASYPALAAWLCGRLTGTPYSFTAHAHDIYVHQEMLREKIDTAEFVVAISEYNQRFLSRYRSGDTPIEIIHCGVDPEEFPYRDHSAEPAHSIRALCVAGLRESKGHQFLLNALAGSEKLAGLNLDLVGDGPLRERLAAICSQLEIAPRVTFHGNLPESEVRELLEVADLFVLPSVITESGDMEGIPVALMESLAVGLPTIATRISGIPELIESREIGILVEQRNVEELADALEDCMSGNNEIDPRLGRNLVEREFNVRLNGRALCEKFRADTA